MEENINIENLLNSKGLHPWDALLANHFPPDHKFPTLNDISSKIDSPEEVYKKMSDIVSNKRYHSLTPNQNKKYLEMVEMIGNLNPDHCDFSSDEFGNKLLNSYLQIF